MSDFCYSSPMLDPDLSPSGADGPHDGACRRQSGRSSSPREGYGLVRGTDQLHSLLQRAAMP